MVENRGLVITAPGKIKLVDVTLRELEPDEILIRVSFVALCGSDCKLYAGSYTAPHQYPIIIGHEWVGNIEQVGAEVKLRWRVGDVVTGDCSIYCNGCSYCLTNKNHCLNIEKRGITQDGACCSYIIVKEQHIYKCPDISDSKIFALAEPLAVSVQGIINRISETELHRVQRALIIGAGGIGILALFALLEYGIPQINIVDLAPEKLAIVHSLGFSHVTPIQTDLSNDRLNPTDGYDLIVEAAGSTLGLKRAVELANPCGKIVCLGHQKTTEIDFGQVIKKSLSIMGSIGSTGGFEKAIEILTTNQNLVGKVITRVVPLYGAEAFFKNELASAKGIKVLIDLS